MVRSRREFDNSSVNSSQAREETKTQHREHRGGHRQKRSCQPAFVGAQHGCARAWLAVGAKPEPEKCAAKKKGETAVHPQFNPRVIVPILKHLSKAFLAWATEHGSGTVLHRRPHQPKLKEMIPASQILDRRKVAPHNSDPDPVRVVPFGRYGGGEWTGHPIGLVIVLGVILMGLIGLPEARWFFAGSLVLGSLCGLMLWLYHR
jgi:hypothetical protein